MNAPFRSSKSKQARKLLLNTITFIQRALGRAARVDSDQVMTVLSDLEKFESELRAYDAAGWPPSLSKLSEEVAYLSGRLRRVLVDKFPDRLSGDAQNDDLERCA